MVAQLDLSAVREGLGDQLAGISTSPYSILENVLLINMKFALLLVYTALIFVYSATAQSASEEIKQLPDHLNLDATSKISLGARSALPVGGSDTTCLGRDGFRYEGPRQLPSQN
jgi:hypothetical protein